MDETKYKAVDDGFHNGVSPCYVSVEDDHFNEDSLVVKLAFSLGEGFEQPVAKIPLLYGPKHVIVSWDNGVRQERKATEADQREAFSFLGRLFPAWAAYCREGGRETKDMLYWFDENVDTVKSARLDIRVKHSSGGFPNAYVMDPAKSKKKSNKSRVSSAAAVTRANAAFASVFGAAAPGMGGAPTPPGAEEDGGDIPF